MPKIKGINDESIDRLRSEDVRFSGLLAIAITTPYVLSSARNKVQPPPCTLRNGTLGSRK